MFTSTFASTILASARLGWVGLLLTFRNEETNHDLRQLCHQGNDHAVNSTEPSCQMSDFIRGHQYDSSYKLIVESLWFVKVSFGGSTISLYAVLFILSDTSFLFSFFCPLLRLPCSVVCVAW